MPKLHHEIRIKDIALALAVGLAFTVTLFAIAAPRAGDTTLHPHIWEAISPGLYIAYVVGSVPGIPLSVAWIVAFVADWLMYSMLFLVAMEVSLILRTHKKVSKR